MYLASNDRLVEQRSRNAEQLDKLRTSAKKHKLFVHKHNDRDDSLLKSPNLCTLSGDTTEMVLVCKTLQRIILDDKNIKSDYLNEAVVDGRHSF